MAVVVADWGADENELVLTGVLTAITDSLAVLIKYAHPPDRQAHPLTLSRPGVEKKFLLENFEILCLVLDEVCDYG